MIVPEEQCLAAYKDLKYHKKGRYIIYKIDNQKIVIENIGQNEQNWESFIGKLPQNQYRFCVFDLEYTNSDNMNKQKLLFINWNPEATPLKGRMMYATSRENFKQHVDLQGKDFSLFAKNDMTEADLIKELE